MELVLPMYNVHPYFPLKNLGKKYALYMAKYSTSSLPYNKIYIFLKKKIFDYPYNTYLF